MQTAIKKIHGDERAPAQEKEINTWKNWLNSQISIDSKRLTSLNLLYIFYTKVFLYESILN